MRSYFSLTHNQELFSRDTATAFIISILHYKIPAPWKKAAAESKGSCVAATLNSANPLQVQFSQVSHRLGRKWSTVNPNAATVMRNINWVGLEANQQSEKSEEEEDVEKLLCRLCDSWFFENKKRICSAGANCREVGFRHPKSVTEKCLTNPHHVFPGLISSTKIHPEGQTDSSSRVKPIMEVHCLRVYNPSLSKKILSFPSFTYFFFRKCALQTGKMNLVCQSLTDLTLPRKVGGTTSLKGLSHQQKF